jgi:hypothetical protein
MSGAGLAGPDFAAEVAVGLVEGRSPAAVVLPGLFRAVIGADSQDATASASTGARMPARIAVVVPVSGWGGVAAGGVGTRRLYIGSRACRL